MSRITLKEAVTLFSREENALSNSYDWYRRSAQRRGTVSLGEVEIPVYKEGAVWYVEKAQLAGAIKKHREELEHIKEVTADYRKGIIRGKTGDILQTSWGGYQIRGKFRLVWSDIERIRKKSYGTWYCNSCNSPAGTKHDKPACHLCRDWYGCGKDCTLSEVYCVKCRHRLKV